MAYERTAIESTSTAPQIPTETMREERVVDPYKARSGQPTISKDSVVAEASAPAEETQSLTLSPAAAALARKEQKFRQEREKFKAEQSELVELRAYKEKIKAKDFSGIEADVPYDAYTNYLIEKGTGTTAEQEALKAVSAKVETLEKSLQDDVSKRFDAAVNERRKVVASLVESKPEFSLIKKAKQQEAVVQHILDTWEHESVDLDPETAAKEVADLLKERATKWAELTKEEQAATGGKELPPLKTGIKTLTNDMAALGDNRPVKSLHGMSETERWAEARRRAEEKLKLRG